MKSNFMKGSLINFIRTLSSKKAGWIPFNEKIKVNAATAWDGKDHAPVTSEEYDINEAGSDKKDDL